MKCGVLQVLTIICVTYVQKEIRFTLLTKQINNIGLLNFHEIAPNFTFFSKTVIF